MALVCPECGIEGLGHLARNCAVCVDGNGVPRELITTEQRNLQLEQARQKHLRIHQAIQAADDAYDEPSHHQQYALF